MLKLVDQYIKENNLFQKGHNLLLAVSGGVDSVFLSHILHKLGYTFSIAHCNFGLRGSESDEDEEFVTDLARQLGVEYHVKSFQIDSQSDSVQARARELRYNWFNEISQAFQFDKILTAHHKGDVAETVLINLGRGTGLEGLHGILPENNRNIVRPLLSISKTEIRNFCVANNIQFREDSSNKSNDYIRNSIRNNVIPELKNIYPQFEESVYKSTLRIQELESLFKELSNNYWNEISTEKNGNTIIHLKELSTIKNKSSYLFYALQNHGFVKSDIVSILNSDTSGKRIESADFILYRDREELILTSKESFFNQEIKIKVQNKTWDFPGGVLKVTVDADLPDISKIESNEVYLDADRLNFPLTLRRWRQGDKFKPLGMQGFKKISDFLIDEKVSVPDKKLVYVLCSGEDITWVVGMRADERFKINSHTEEVLNITKL